MNNTARLRRDIQNMYKWDSKFAAIAMLFYQYSPDTLMVHDTKPNKNNKYYFTDEIQYSAQNHNVTLTACSAHRVAFIQQLH
jgi:hypothetical protein